MLLAIDALNLYSECICNFYVEWWIKSIFSEYLSGVVLILVMHQWFIFTKFSITTSCMHTKSHFVRSSINLNIAKNSSNRNNSYIMRQIISFLYHHSLHYRHCARVCRINEVTVESFPFQLQFYGDARYLQKNMIKPFNSFIPFRIFGGIVVTWVRILVKGFK